MVENKTTWLITLPHAGGSTTVYKRWSKKITCNMLNIEYPGHWTRMKEPLIDSFSELAEDVLGIIRGNIPAKADIFLCGHSIGAIMSWYIAPLLCEEGFAVKGMFLSGSQNPGSFPEKSIIESTSDKEMLRLIGYKIEEHEEAINEQFMKTFLPILKNDMQVCKSFVCDNHFVDIDSVVLFGAEDIFTDIKEMENWKKYVKLVSMYEFPGEHLFIDNPNNIDRIIELINSMI